MRLYLEFALPANIMLHKKRASTQPQKVVLFFLVVVAMGLLFVSFKWQQLMFGEAARVEVAEVAEEVVISQNSLEEVSLPAEEPSVRFIFGGDLQFDRYIRQQATVLGGYENLLEDIAKLLTLSDGVIANLEGPVTQFESVSVGSEVGSSANYLFTFSPEVVPVLQAHNFVLVNLGNNHILNFGQEGLAQTREFLQKEGIHYWGNTGGENWLEDSFTVLTKNDLTFLFINYNEFLWGDTDELLAEIPRQIERKNPDFTVVYTHWGTEYQTHASERYQDLARRFVASGVDLVVGSHPHVVQQNEVMQGVPIYYSLGNFVFDQYFEDPVRKGLLLEVVFQKGEELRVREIPIYLEGTGKTILFSSPMEQESL